VVQAAAVSMARAATGRRASFDNSEVAWSDTRSVERAFLECGRRNERGRAVWLIILEALLALGLLIFIVWWTMFHGRGRKPPER